MNDAIKAGQVKIAKVARATNAVGDVVNFVNKSKGVIDLAVSSNPQAPLPWAGVCIRPLSFGPGPTAIMPCRKSEQKQGNGSQRLRSFTTVPFAMRWAHDFYQI
jgi:hypothetical protein